MNDVYESLCIHDPRNPDYIEDEGYPQKPRDDCACDNCFYRRDPMAVVLVDLLEESLIDALGRLMRQNNAYLSAEDHYSGFPDCGKNIRMSLIVNPEYNKDGDNVRGFEEYDLGKHFDGTA